MSLIELRLQKFILVEGLKVSHVEKNSGLSNALLRTHFNTKSRGLALKNLEKVLKAYPQLNREWLMYGKGEMLNPGYSTNTLVVEEDKTDYNLTQKTNFLELFTHFPSLCILNKKNQITEVNDSFCQQTGFSHRQLINQTPGKVLLPNDFPPQRKVDIKEKLRAGVPFHEEFETLHSKGFAQVSKFYVFPVTIEKQVEQHIVFGNFVPKPPNENS